MNQMFMKFETCTIYSRVYYITYKATVVSGFVAEYLIHLQRFVHRSYIAPA